MEPDKGPQTFKGCRVTLVIRVYNSERYLVPCLESALAQTYGDIEIMAVNDGSTDGSAEILGRYSDRIRIVDTEHRGRAAAYNAAIARMTGEWLATLDSDDMMYPDAVEQLVRAAERLGSSSATRVIPFFNYRFIGADGRPTGREARPYRMDNSMGPIEQGASMLNEYFGKFVTSIIHRSILEDAGGFDEEFDRCEDMELSMRLVLMHGYRYHKIPKIIYGCRTHDGQDKTKVLDHEKTKYMVHRKMIAGLGDADRKKYVEAVRRITPRMSVMTVCRDTVRLLGMLVHGSHDRTSDASEAGKSLVIIVGSLVYGPHDGAAARLASWTLRMLLANPLVQRLMNPIRFRVMASRGRVRQYV